MKPYRVIARAKTKPWHTEPTLTSRQFNDLESAKQWAIECGGGLIERYVGKALTQSGFLADRWQSAEEVKP